MSSYRFCTMHNLFLNSLLIKNVSSSTSLTTKTNTNLLNISMNANIRKHIFFIKLMSKKVFFMFKNPFIKKFV